MGVVLVNMSVSVDGFGAGPDVNPEQPMGKGGERLHDWMFSTGDGCQVAAEGTSLAEVDAEIVQDLIASTGAVVVGRRTFDLGVGPWAMCRSRCRPRAHARPMSRCRCAAGRSRSSPTGSAARSGRPRLRRGAERAGAARRRHRLFERRRVPRRLSWSARADARVGTGHSPALPGSQGGAAVSLVAQAWVLTGAAGCIATRQFGAGRQVGTCGC